MAQAAGPKVDIYRNGEQWGVTFDAASAARFGDQAMFEQLGRDGNGYDWEEVFRAALRREDPGSVDKINWDPESSMFAAYSDARAPMEALRTAMLGVLRDQGTLAAAVAHLGESHVATTRRGMDRPRTNLLMLGVVGVVGFGVYRLAHWWNHRADGVATGYANGEPFEIVLVTIDGKPVETTTATAFRRMRQAAATVGVRLQVVSGFRSMDEQEYLHRCHVTGRCNNGNFAEQPGHSKHQSGRALDLNAHEAGVHAWLVDHAGEHGFYATVPGEPWHWEFWGRSPPRSATATV
jgi:D-alanyl-D-alanine carboxypeptidase